jgi:hypothetical protein
MIIDVTDVIVEKCKHFTQLKQIENEKRIGINCSVFNDNRMQQ